MLVDTLAGVPIAAQEEAEAAPGSVFVNPTGIAATGAVGDVTLNTEISVLFEIDGLVGNIALGIPVVPQDITVEPAGLEITSGQGTADVVLFIEADVTGQAMTGAVGDVVARVNIDVPITAGVEMEIVSEQGEPEVPVGINFPVTGLGAVAGQGSVAFSIGGSTGVTGQAITSAQGSVTAKIGARVPVSGFGLATAQGTVETLGDIIPVPVNGVGLVATGQVGNVTIDTELNVLLVPEGLEMTGVVDNALVWGLIPDGPDGQWVEIVT